MGMLLQACLWQRELSVAALQVHAAQLGSPLPLSSLAAMSTSPEEAAADLAAIEALLTSAKADGTLVEVLQGAAPADGKM